MENTNKHNFYWVIRILSILALGAMLFYLYKHDFSQQGVLYYLLIITLLIILFYGKTMKKIIGFFPNFNDISSNPFFFIVFFSFIFLIVGTYTGLFIAEKKIKVSYIMPVVISMSIILTAWQFGLTRRWNKKEAGIKGAMEVSEKIFEVNKKLNKIIDINKAVDDIRRLTLDEIHNSMGCFMKDGTFIHHGEHSSDDWENINTTTGNFCKKFNDSFDGKEVIHWIESILNEYEYVCLACQEDVFDKKTVKDLMAGKIVMTCHIFYNYILHLQYDERHKGANPSTYEQLVTFAKELYPEVKEYMPDVVFDITSIDKSNYIVDFPEGS